MLTSYLSKFFINEEEKDYREAAERLKELQRYTDSLNFEGLSRLSRGDASKLTVKVKEGRSTGYGLLHNEDIAIVHGFSEKGTRTSFFHHDQTSILVVYKGRVEVTSEDPITLGCAGTTIRKLILTPGSVFVCPPKKNKVLFAEEDTYFISITVPASPLYPEAASCLMGK